MGFLPGVGTPELIIVGIIALLLFGKNLPNVARNAGKSFAEFKKGISGFQEEMHKVSREAEKTISYTPKSTESSPEDRPKPAEEEAEASNDDDFSAPRFDVT
ncbi:MAG TPA: twin-arginine translocase TatA/TatE family subunit [Planctomycetaceae bacterium]|nr:twin-arginine translocase TatA/TatE family subunit [Planctomycetaceae bacterium]